MIRLRDYLKIAHHIPGRIRVKVSPAILANPEALRLAASVDLGELGNGGNGHPAIINTRVNKSAGSLVLEYDPIMIAPASIEELFKTRDDVRFEQLLTRLADLLGLKIEP